MDRCAVHGRCRDAAQRPDQNRARGAATGDTAGIKVDISEFKTCVNDDMTTIGKWSANVGSR